MEPSLEELEHVDQLFSYTCNTCDYGPWCQDCRVCWWLVELREEVERMTVNWEE